MRYQTILLDADGTLLDFHKTEQQALKNTLLQHHVPYNESIVSLSGEINHSLWEQFEKGEITQSAVVNTRFQKLFKQLNISADGFAFEQEYQEALGNGSFLMPDALPVCQELSKCCQLYIVTNGVAKTQYKRIKESGLSPYFNGIYISEEIGYQKPQAAFFTAVFDKIPGLDLSKTVIVGDSLTSDIQGGINAGIDTCYFNPAHKELPAGMKITYEISHLTELVKMIKQEGN